MNKYWDAPLPKPAKRTIEEMREVLAQPQCRADSPLYFMYRDCAKTNTDRSWLNKHHLRYDITVIPPAILCGEYVKTKGHYHPETSQGTGYPELYQVLSGRAYYLVQNKNLSNIAVIVADPGDAVLIPPDMGHVTINPGDEILIMANIVSTRFDSEYAVYEAMHGAAYYFFEKDGWMKNPAYPVIPALRSLTQKRIPELCIRPGLSIYDFIGKEECLMYLNYPEEFRDRICWL